MALLLSLFQNSPGANPRDRTTEVCQTDDAKKQRAEFESPDVAVFIDGRVVNAPAGRPRGIRRATGNQGFA